DLGQGHDQRTHGLHRPRRGHRRARRVPARGRVSEASGPAPRAPGGPVLRARLRETPGDFRGEELDAFDASGGGERLLLAVEKRALNTAFVARRIARSASVTESAVGYAGTKIGRASCRERV